MIPIFIPGKDRIGYRAPQQEHCRCLIVGQRIPRFAAERYSESDFLVRLGVFKRQGDFSEMLLSGANLFDTQF